MLGRCWTRSKCSSAAIVESGYGFKKRSVTPAGISSTRSSLPADGMSRQCDKFLIGSCRNCCAGSPAHWRRSVRIWPGLEKEQLFEGRDLAVTIDYRDVLGELIGGRLGQQDLGVLLRAQHERLGSAGRAEEAIRR